MEAIDFSKINAKKIIINYTKIYPKEDINLENNPGKLVSIISNLISKNVSNNKRFFIKKYSKEEGKNNAFPKIRTVPESPITNYVQQKSIEAASIIKTKKRTQSNANRKYKLFKLFHRSPLMHRKKEKSIYSPVQETNSIPKISPIKKSLRMEVVKNDEEIDVL